ncbi:hypothetical protein [Nonomuraea longicatena]
MDDVGSAQAGVTLVSGRVSQGRWAEFVVKGVGAVDGSGCDL